MDLLKVIKPSGKKQITYLISPMGGYRGTDEGPLSGSLTVELDGDTKLKYITVFVQGDQKVIVHEKVTVVDAPADVSVHHYEARHDNHGNNALYTNGRREGRDYLIYQGQSDVISGTTVEKLFSGEDDSPHLGQI